MGYCVCVVKGCFCVILFVGIVCLICCYWIGSVIWNVYFVGLVCLVCWGWLCRLVLWMCVGFCCCVYWLLLLMCWLGCRCCRWLVLKCWCSCVVWCWIVMWWLGWVRFGLRWSFLILMFVFWKGSWNFFWLLISRLLGLCWMLMVCCVMWCWC